MKLETLRKPATLAAVFAIGAALSSAPATAQDKKDEKAKDPVVAVVDGHSIRLSDLRALHASLPGRIRQLPMQRIYRPLLEHAITTYLLAKAGRAAGLEKDKQVKELVESYQQRVVAQVHLRRVVDKKISEDELKKAYEAYKANFKGKEEVRASHILVKTKKEAQEIIAQLGKGGDFAKLAQEKSTGPSKSKGGDLGFFEKDQMVKPFAEAAFKLKKGEYTKEPVKTQFGWHVIKVVDRRTTAAPPYEKVKAKLRNDASRKVQGEVVKGLREKAKIERYAMDGSKPKPAAPK